ncbi:hypothetical protein FIBSPDRAFT_926237 [Athelia psychrophila]|uniref:PX domain-containing protein n=1 Tax=Athelia psychrophila TaxID=1759441 RepID=A0A166TMG9_9AGAM|nr:hypothetical protein FIBSPDRAFT_926237 [Fibularhizoctonia sp. CBS 109695]
MRVGVAGVDGGWHTRHHHQVCARNPTCTHRSKYPPANIPTTAQWASAYTAYALHYLFVAAPNAHKAFYLLQILHHFFPYALARQLLKIAKGVHGSALWRAARRQARVLARVREHRGPEREGAPAADRAVPHAGRGQRGVRPAARVRARGAGEGAREEPHGRWTRGVDPRAHRAVRGAGGGRARAHGPRSKTAGPCARASSRSRPFAIKPVLGPHLAQPCADAMNVISNRNPMASEDGGIMCEDENGSVGELQTCKDTLSHDGEQTLDEMLHSEGARTHSPPTYTTRARSGG